MQKEIKWNNKEYKPVYSYKQNEIQWHVIIHDDFYIFVAELTGGGILEFMRVSPLQHAILRSMRLLANDNVNEHFKKDLEDVLGE